MLELIKINQNMELRYKTTEATNLMLFRAIFPRAYKKYIKPDSFSKKELTSCYL